MSAEYAAHQRERCRNTPAIGFHSGLLQHNRSDEQSRCDTTGDSEYVTGSLKQTLSTPRIGLAYRPIASNDNLVLRAGYGIYWSAIPGTVFEQESFDPWMITVRAGGSTAPEATFQNPWVPPPPGEFTVHPAVVDELAVRFEELLI